MSERGIYSIKVLVIGKAGLARIQVKKVNREAPVSTQIEAWCTDIQGGPPEDPPTRREDVHKTCEREPVNC